MKHNKEHIDEIFREKLGDDRHYAIPEDYLTDLNKKLEARKNNRRKGLIFLSLIFLGLLSSVAGIWYYSGSNMTTKTDITNNDLPSVESVQKNEENDSNSDKTTVEIINDSSKSNFSTEGMVSDQIDKPVSDEYTYTQNFPNSSETNKEETEQSALAHTISQKNSGNKKHEDSSINESEEVNRKRSKQNNSNNLNTQGDVNFEKHKISSEIPIRSETLDSDNEKTKEDIDATTDHDVNQHSDSEKTDATEEKIVDINDTDTLIVEQKSDIDSVDSMSPAVDSITTVEINSDDQKPRKFWIDVNAHAGADLIQPKLFGTTPEETDIFNSAHNSKLVSNFGLTANFNFRNLFSGIGFSVYNFKDEIYHGEYDVNTTTYDTVLTVFNDSIVYDSLNNPIDTVTYSTYDTTTYDVTDSSWVNYDQFNRYSIFAIPISFGYTFTLNHWKIRPMLNAIFEFRRKQSVGTYPIYNGSTVLEQLQAVKFGMSLSFATQFQRDFQDWYVYFRPAYRYRITNVAENGSYYIKHHAFQAHLGVGYTF